jgi:hypothetical protein
MLPAYNDCARRAAARQYRRLISEAGFELRETDRSIGAMMGIAVHRVAESYYRARLADEDFSLSKAIEAAIEALKMESVGGLLWDDTTPTIDAAATQLTRIATAYINGIGRAIDPIAVECRVVADLGEGWELSGTIDVVSRVEGGCRVHDIKTGVLARSYHAQLGAYALLVRSAELPGLPTNITELVIDFVERTPRRRPQAAPESERLPVYLCEQIAWTSILRIRRDVQSFIASGNPDAFPENPMSLLCSAKFCPAFNTEFCKITKVWK